MTSNSFFRKLTAGAHFDLNKFEKDAITLKLRRVDRNGPTNPDEQDQNPDNPVFDGQKRVDQLRDQHQIQVIGEDVPDPLDTFERMKDEFQVPNFLLRNLQKARFTRPTPVQMQAIPLMMNKRELICCSFTGSGKTLAFLLPLITQLYLNPNEELKNLSDQVDQVESEEEEDAQEENAQEEEAEEEDEKDGDDSGTEPNLQNRQTSRKCCAVRAVVLAPTCDLAKQIYQESLWFSHGSHLRVRLINNVYKFNEKCLDILITTPKRLVYLLRKRELRLDHCEFLVVDECDRLFEHGFRSQMSVIYQACAVSLRISRALFSATFNRRLEQWFQLNLDSVCTLLVGKKLSVPRSIRQELKFVGDANGKYMAVQSIIREGIQPPVLLFCQYRKSAYALYSRMKSDNHNVALIHSGVPESKRLSIINRFREGRIWFLICTDLMGRGIDFKGVSCLINYDYPHDPISYIHRIGRTGRAGKYGRAITLFTNEEMEHPTKLRYIVTIMKQSGWPVPDYLSDVKKLAQLPADKRKKRFFTESGKLDRKRQKQHNQKKREKEKKMASKKRKRRQSSEMNQEIDSN